MASFTLTLYSKLPEKAPVGRLLLDSNRTQISWETIDPGGFSSLTVGLPTDGSRVSPGYLPVHEIDIQAQQHVELRFSGGVRILWEGQIAELDRGLNGMVSGFVADGYGVGGFDDRPLEIAGSTAMTNGQLLAYCLPVLSDYLRVGNSQQFVDPGGDTSHTLNDFAGKNLEQISTQVMNEGDGRGTAYRVRVWENATVFLQPYAPPDVMDYVIPWDNDAITQWKENYRDMRTSARATYSGGTVGPYTGVPLTAMRPRSVLLDGGTLTTAGATSWVQVYLQDHLVPDYGIELTYGVPDGATDVRHMRSPTRPGGRPAIPWLVRAGQWISIAAFGPFAITRTSFDADSQQLTVRIGSYWLDEVDLWREMRTDQAKLRRRIHPVSGGTY